MQVKAVFRRELAKMKDVIVFPTKGQFSLAEKLSGYVGRSTLRRF